MSDKNLEQSSVNTRGLRPATPVARWKRWHHKSRIFLIVLGIVAIVVYLVQAGLAKQYAGLGAALCVISVGGFLVWHAMHVFLEEDVIEEREINKPDVTTPPESGQDLK
jgi:divalent metal cation (Fe/Co/Zn/Cd) transporter